MKALSNLENCPMTKQISVVDNAQKPATRPRRRTLGLLAVAVVGMSSPSMAGVVVTVPPGLAPGSVYRLVFVTANSTYTPASSNISTYNTGVNNEANNLGGDTGSLVASLGATWSVIASTTTTDAQTNIGVDIGVPIYDVEGNKIADDAGTGPGGLYSGSLLNPISYNELGVSLPTGTSVWTGTSYDGTPDFAFGGPTYALFGQTGTTAVGWTFTGRQGITGTASLYAISGELMVPPAPEPATTGMGLAGLALLMFARLRSRSGRQSARTLV